LKATAPQHSGEQQLCKALHPCASPINEQGLPSSKLGGKELKNYRNINVIGLNNYLMEAGTQEGATIFPPQESFSDTLVKILR
jgi:hypothetical protein